MKFQSLKVRLLVAWIVFVALTLLVSGLGLRILYENGITRRTVTELEADLRQLRRGFEISAAGEGQLLRPPTDPQFETLFGGRYWQIMRGGKPVLRSASLASTVIDNGSGQKTPAGNMQYAADGPQNQKLVVVKRDGALKGGPGAQEFSFMAAVDAAEITEDVDHFSADILKGLFSIALLLIAGAWAQVTIGLKPLEALRSGVAAIRGGTARRIEGDFPSEVLPLIEETNELLIAQDAALAKARARASDLAHGLNTPLAILSATSRTLQRHGEAQASDDIDQQVETMRRHVERELARARAKGKSGGRLSRTDLTAAVRDLVSAMGRVPRAQELIWDVQLVSPQVIAVDRDDLNNILGNLLENAQKWAKTRIVMSAIACGNMVQCSIEDDGIGVAPGQIERILGRGVRADTSISGSGLGLAIVSDLVELNGGKLELSQSTLGGLKVTVSLTAAQT